MLSSRRAAIATMTISVALGLTACGGSSAPKVTSADDAEYWINDYMNTGYSMWNANGNPMGPATTCTDANGMWIAGCQAWFYLNARPIQGPADSAWSYWQVDGVTQYDTGEQRVNTQCFGLIPPYDDYGTQLYEVDCRNTSRPPGG